MLRFPVTAAADTEREARSLASAVSVSTSGGRIRADGPARGRDEHWSVSFELLVPRNANVTLNTHNGGISIADFQGTARFGARNGGVRMAVPADYSARLETGTVNGGFRIDFPITVQGRLPGGRNRTLNTALGSGGPTIRVVTTNGGVTIARR